MADLPTWTVSLTDAVQKARTLSDLGVWPIQTVRLIARCSFHGRQELVVETTDQLGDGILSGRLVCKSCGTMGLTRWLPIEEFVLVGS